MTECTSNEKVYWQIAAGYRGRDYTQDFLRFGIAFVGGEDKIYNLKKVRLGDILLLKNGLSKIAAVGKVIERDGKYAGDGDKNWLHDFDGWDLPAYCFVEWYVPSSAVPVAGLRQGTIYRINKTHIYKIAERILNTVPAQKVDAEPSDTMKVDDDRILSFLIREGLRPHAAEELTAAFRRIRLLAQYYKTECFHDNIREHETRTFLIIPLLLALGWAEQQIKIELNVPYIGRIDVACFAKPYRRGEHGEPNNSDCTLILESKGFSSGLDFAHEQAKEYAEHFPSCHVVVVSNGFCYKAYTSSVDGSFSGHPTAYLNLLDPRDRYPLRP